VCRCSVCRVSVPAWNSSRWATLFLFHMNCQLPTSPPAPTPLVLAKSSPWGYGRAGVEMRACVPLLMQEKGDRS
jgi:hypothetical protein